MKTVQYSGKILLAIAALIFLAPIVIHAQKNFAPLGAEWKYEGHEIDCLGNHQKFTVEQEVMIEDKDCSVIYAYLWEDEAEDWVWTQDSLIVWEADSKVFFLEGSEFYLLYDFDVELGDTIRYYDPINQGLFSSTVSSISQTIPNGLLSRVASVETIEVSGQSLKKFDMEHVDETDNLCKDLRSVIENIGSTSQRITGDWCVYVTMGCFGSIVCYRSPTLAYDSGFLDCNNLTNNTEDEQLYQAIRVFPNPAHDQLHVSPPAAYTRGEFRLFNTAGQVQFSQQLEGLETTSLQIGQLPSGVYWYRLTNVEGNSIQGKLLIRH